MEISYVIVFFLNIDEDLKHLLYDVIEYDFSCHDVMSSLHWHLFDPIGSI